MTPTPNPTAEPLKSWEVNDNAWDAFSGEEHLTNGIQAAYEAGLRAHGLLSEGAPSEDALRDAVDHIRGAVEFQDTISPEAVRVLTDAAILDRPKIQDPATTTLVAEAREWAKYDSTGASKIVIELCNALTAAGVAPQEPSDFGESATVAVTPKAGKVLDPVKVAEVVERATFEWSAQRVAYWRDPRNENPAGDLNSWIVRALCVAYTEGKLT